MVVEGQTPSDPPVIMSKAELHHLCESWGRKGLMVGLTVGLVVGALAFFAGLEWAVSR